MPTIERLAKVFNIAFVFPTDKFSIDTVPDDVPKWDSIGHMNLVAEMEKEFGVQFEVDEIMEMATVEKIIEILNNKGVAD